MYLYAIKVNFRLILLILNYMKYFLNLKKKNNNNLEDFHEILNIIYDIVFPNLKQDSPTINKKKLEQVYEELELSSYLDYSQGIKENIIEDIYEKK